jgi:hypothetical protein
MKRLFAVVCAVCIAAVMTGSALGLEIQLGPQTLVLSSGGDQLTIHTDFPYRMVDEVYLDIGDDDVSVVTWADDCGNLVARCSKNAVKEAVGDFDGKFTTVDVKLIVWDLDGKHVEGVETLRVRK